MNKKELENTFYIVCNEWIDDIKTYREDFKGGVIMNNIHDKVFTCPKCENKTLYPVNGNNNVVGIGYHDVCICEECAAELHSEPQFDYTVKFAEITEE